MQWSYHLRSTILATTSKFKMAIEIGVFRLIREAHYTFVLRSQQLPQNFVGSFKLTCQLFTRFLSVGFLWFLFSDDFYMSSSIPQNFVLKFEKLRPIRRSVKMWFFLQSVIAYAIYMVKAACMIMLCKYMHVPLTYFSQITLPAACRSTPTPGIITQHINYHKTSLKCFPAFLCIWRIFK